MKAREAGVAAEMGVLAGPGRDVQPATNVELNRLAAFTPGEHTGDYWVSGRVDSLQFGFYSRHRFRPTNQNTISISISISNCGGAVCCGGATGVARVFG